MTNSTPPLWDQKPAGVGLWPRRNWACSADSRRSQMQEKLLNTIDKKDMHDKIKFKQYLSTNLPL